MGEKVDEKVLKGPNNGYKIKKIMLKIIRKLKIGLKYEKNSQKLLKFDQKLSKYFLKICEN